MRIVVKIGSALLTNDKSELNRVFLEQLIGQIALLHKQGHEIIIVSSGAVASGRSEVKFDHEKKNIPFRQALAAVGQGLLMEAYRNFFRNYKISVAQALLTNYDFTNRENFLNTKNVFELLLGEKVVPIVNENDVTTIAELKFGDNDMLSAKTAAMVSAEALFILTDVNGLYSIDPKKSKDAKIIPVVKKVSDSILALAGGCSSGRGTGGMITKLEAAKYVTDAGCAMFIVNGKKENILGELAEFCEANHGDENEISDPCAEGAPRLGKACWLGSMGTFFPPVIGRIQNQKKWLRPKIIKNVAIEVDVGAAKAILEKGKSLLPSGILKVEGKFFRGDVVIVKSAGSDICFGQVNYGSVDLEKIKKHRSSEIEKILGFSFEDEVMHRDRMVI